MSAFTYFLEDRKLSSYSQLSKRDFFTKLKVQRLFQNHPDAVVLNILIDKLKLRLSIYLTAEIKSDNGDLWNSNWFCTIL